MKLLTLTTALLTASICFGIPRAPETPEMLQRCGGYVQVVGSMKGSVTFADCQTSADREWFEEVISYLRKETDIDIALKDKCEFKFPSPEIIGNLTIFTVEDANLPTLLIAPESRWALVNLTPLKSEKRQFFAMRTKKELVRAFAALCGGSASRYKGGVVGGVASLNDLDKPLDYRLQIDVLERLRNYLEPFGVTPAIVTTYLSACSHGVAPAPTNEYQKAIWDQVRAIPNKPMKIEFDPATKKGKVTK